MIPVRFVDPGGPSTEGSRMFKPALCAEPEAWPIPRMCHLKRLEGQNFGFYLQVDENSRALEVQTVESWSPAELSGLRDGDRVLEVNEEFVDKMEFHKVGVQNSEDLTIQQFSVPRTRLKLPIGPFSFCGLCDTSCCLCTW